MHKGKQLEQIQPRQFRIAEPLRHQRRVEHDERCLRRPPDSLSLANRPHLPVGGSQPDTGMARMEGREGEFGRRGFHALSHSGGRNVRETVYLYFCFRAMQLDALKSYESQCARHSENSLGARFC